MKIQYFALGAALAAAPLAAQNTMPQPGGPASPPAGEPMPQSGPGTPDGTMPDDRMPTPDGTTSPDGTRLPGNPGMPDPAQPPLGAPADGTRPMPGQPPMPSPGSPQQPQFAPLAPPPPPTVRSEYPPCSRTVTDNCIQRNDPGNRG